MLNDCAEYFFEVFKQGPEVCEMLQGFDEND